MFRYGPVGLHHSPHVLAWLFVILLGALVVVGVLLLVRLWNAPGRRAGADPSRRPPYPMVDPAITELRMRYARGDITSDEYSARAGHLGYPTTPGPGPGSVPPEGQTSPTTP